MGKIDNLEKEVLDLKSKIERYTSLPEWKFKQNVENGEKLSVDESDWEERNPGFHWSLKEGQAYFRKWIEVPSEIEGIKIEGSDILLLFLFPSGVEVFVDEKKVYQYKFWADKIAVPLPFINNVKIGEKHLVVFKTPSGDGLGWSPGPRLYIEKIEEILFELKTIIYQIKFALHITKWFKRKNLINTVQNALEVLNIQDLKERKWENFLSQIKEAEKLLEVFRPIVKKFKIHLIGHAHIDMNWLWDYPDTINVCLRDFSSVINLMEEYPSLTFSQSQTHIYKIVEENDPELFKKVIEKIKEKRWEVTANGWVEGDLNMAEGESIVRHILYSKKYIKEKLKTNSFIMWSPDTFGHPISIPTILGNSEIKYYYFMRCGKNLPVFRWRGRDGSEVIAFNSAYNNRIESDRFLPLFIDFYNRYKINEMMFVYGIGDHGGGPTKIDINKKEILDKKPVIPSLEFSTTERFFSFIEKSRSKLPVIKEELNTIYEGCYTTHSDIKKANRESEHLLLSLETISAIANLKGENYPERELEEMWHTTCFNQFHDILDGSAIHSSYEYSIQIANQV
ncbi:MAG: hypothetical protein NC832_02170, partial [Candidatus Omnitrophica bacterium]|nr:hypothetical protein [Candidatus Omnitrophota bacterium]